MDFTFEVVHSTTLANILLIFLPYGRMVQSTKI